MGQPPVDVWKLNRGINFSAAAGWNDFVSHGLALGKVATCDQQNEQEGEGSQR